MTEDRKAKIARLRKLVKAKCKTLRVRRGRGTVGAWVEILSGNAGAEFSDQEKVALNHLGLPHVANSASIAPEDLDATLRWLEARHSSPPSTDDMIQVARPKGWRVSQYAGVFSIVDERGDAVADCYSNKEDALTIAASRELLEACKYLLKNTLERGIEVEQLKKALAAIHKAHER